MLARAEGVTVAPPATLLRDATQGLELYRANMTERLLHPRRRRAQTRVQLLVPLADRFVGPDMARSATHWADGVVVHELAGGHWIVRKEPATIAGLVAGWVER